MFRKQRSVLSVVFLFAFAPSVCAEEMISPYLLVLGVAQDAGYPQAGCYKPHCMRAWENPELRRTPTSFAVIDPENKTDYLFEATPDIKLQLYRLHQETGPLDHTLGGIFITHAHIGHYTGLMHFGREVMGSKNVPVYTMPRMAQFLATNGPWSLLTGLKNIHLKPMSENKVVDLSEQIAVQPLLVPHREEFSETIGFRIKGPNKSALFIPDIDRWEEWPADLKEVISKIDYAFLDGTFYTDGELGGRDMSTIPHPLVTYTMELLSDLEPDERAKVHFLHFNHTNPLLDDSSPEVRNVETKGFKIAREGLKLRL